MEDLQIKFLVPSLYCGSSEATVVIPAKGTITTTP
jgi:hypothetical protein